MSVACMGEVSGLERSRLDQYAFVDWISVLLQIRVVRCCELDLFVVADSMGR